MSTVSFHIDTFLRNPKKYLIKSSLKTHEYLLQQRQDTNKAHFLHINVDMQWKTLRIKIHFFLDPNIFPFFFQIHIYIQPWQSSLATIQPL